MKNTKQIEEAAYLLKAIANCTRLSIILLLSEKGELNVSQLQEELNCEQTVIAFSSSDRYESKRDIKLQARKQKMLLFPEKQKDSASN